MIREYLRSHRCIRKLHYLFQNMSKLQTLCNMLHIFRFMESNAGIGHLLGDSGYASKTYLLTPFLRPVNQQQRRYNFAHCDTRVVIEQAFGRLKRRFYILGSEIRLNYRTAPRIIVACVMLHNMAIRRRLPDFPDENEENDDADNEGVEEIGQPNLSGLNYRSEFVNRIFLIVVNTFVCFIKIV